MSAYDEAGEWYAVASTKIGCNCFYYRCFLKILSLHDTSLFMYTLSDAHLSWLYFLYRASMEIFFLCLFLSVHFSPEWIALLS
jgi:hypothetical protein